MAKRPRDGDRPDREIDLSGLFVGLGSIVERLGGVLEKAEQVRQESSGTFEIKNLGENARGEFGVSVRLGLGGIPQVQRFGNIRATESGPEVADVREPLVDVFDEADEIVVTAELPGVADDDIRIAVDGDILRLETGGERRYAKDIPLPVAVDAASLSRSYRNGILDVRLKKA